LEIQPEILAGLKDTGFVQCTPIQAQTLPVALSGKDVAGQAQTGTGKTAVFMVTVFSRLLSLPERPVFYPCPSGRPACPLPSLSRLHGNWRYRSMKMPGRSAAIQVLAWPR